MDSNLDNFEDKSTEELEAALALVVLMHNLNAHYERSKKRFDAAWKALEASGRVEPFSGRDYQRVFKEFEDACCPYGTMSFIIRHTKRK